MNSLVYLEVSPPNTIVGGTSPRRDAIGGSCWGGLSLHYIANFKKFLKNFWELFYTLQCYIYMSIHVSYRNEVQCFLVTLPRKVLVKMCKSWKGNEGVNYETTEDADLILLILDSLDLNDDD